VQIRTGPGSPIGKNTGSSVDQNTKQERKKIIIIIIIIVAARPDASRAKRNQLRKHSSAHTNRWTACAAGAKIAIKKI
jgi:hypothetical protein